MDIPVIGMGGIESGKDAIAFMMAGAKAVQVGTSNFTDGYSIPRIVKEIDEWLGRHGVVDINEIVDTLILN